MPVVRLRPLAREDILEIWTYIAADNLAAADAIVDRFDRAFFLSAMNPRSGRARPNIGAGIRSFAVGNYVVFYRPVTGGVDIGRVLHGKRNILPADILRSFAILDDGR